MQTDLWDVFNLCMIIAYYGFFGWLELGSILGFYCEEIVLIFVSKHTVVNVDLSLSTWRFV